MAHIVEKFFGRIRIFCLIFRVIQQILSIFEKIFEKKIFWSNIGVFWYPPYLVHPQDNSFWRNGYHFRAFRQILGLKMIFSRF